MPAWIEKRKDRILKDNPDMDESQAWAIATQQAHKLGKTPKGYGTSEAKAEAKKKYDKPASDYKKTAALMSIVLSDSFFDPVVVNALKKR